jgi:phosphoserine aminotransferase
MAELNSAKAQVLYEFLDQTEFYYSPSKKRPPTDECSFAS